MKRAVLAAAVAAALFGGCPQPGQAPENSDPRAESNPDITGRVDPGAPASPNRITPTDEVSGDAVDLRWFPVGGVQHYSVYAGTTQDPPLLFKVTTNSYRLDGLALCTTYYWRVEAENDKGVTSSPLWSFRTRCPADRPDAPAYPAPSNKAYGIPVREQSGAGPTLYWKTAPRAEIYDVYFGLTPNPPYFASSYEPRLINMPPLIEKQRYYWRVVAKNHSGDTSSQEWTFTATTSAAGPPAPANVFPPDNTHMMPSLLRLDWNDSRGAHSYRVYLGTTAEPPLAAVVAASEYTTPADLALAATYYWRVEAVGDGGAGSTPVWSFATADTPQPPLTPRAPHPENGAVGIGMASALSWAPIANARAYDVYLGAAGSEQFVERVSTASYQPATPLEPNMVYLWYVVAVNDVGESEGPLWRFVTGDTSETDGGGDDGSDDGGGGWGGDDGGGGGGAAGGPCTPVLARINVTPSGGESAGHASGPAFSADGRYAAFVSAAGDLVPGDTNGGPDVFVRDLHNGLTTRVSVDSSGAQASGGATSVAISAGGRYVAFETLAALAPQDTNGEQDVYVHDMVTSQTRWVSFGGNRDAGHPAISGDGRYVAFYTRARNLAGDNNNKADVYVYDTSNGSLDRASILNGVEGNKPSAWPSLSHDGRFVCFWSDAENWGTSPGKAGIYVRDRVAGTTTHIGNGLAPVISSDGVWVASVGRWAGSNSSQIVLLNRLSGAKTLASVAPNGTPGDWISWLPAISGDGRFVAFSTLATNLVDGDQNGKLDIYRYDVATGITLRVSQAINGEVSANCGRCAISTDGRTIGFDSTAPNLVPADTNGRSDAFVICYE